MCRFCRVTEFALVGILAVLLSATVWADTLVLKNSKVLQGTFKRGTESVIQFEAGGGLGAGLETRKAHAGFSCFFPFASV